jgi:hypothetical protein
MMLATLAAPEALSKLFDTWSHIYGDSKVLTTIVQYLHVAPLLFAGGLAVTLDRATFRAVGGDVNLRTRQLQDLALAHRIVVAGLALSLVSGVLMFASDIDTFWGSWIWWTKATMIVLLLANGYIMTRTEARLRANPPDVEAVWGRLRRTAVISISLWFAIALAGVALTNV